MAISTRVRPRSRRRVALQWGTALLAVALLVALVWAAVDRVLFVSPLLREKMRLNERRREANLHNLALAVHLYHGTKRKLPPAVVHSKDGRPLLSWRVLILPYIDEKNLYEEFDLDQPWDSPHNKALLSRMPEVYALPGRRPGSDTHYRVFVGEGTAFERTEKGLRIPEDFPDGASKTLLIVEAREPVPWTKPDELPYAAAEPLPPLGASSKDGFYAAFGDGSVRYIDMKESETRIRAYITRNGGD
jgi:hypothetical protein